MLSTPIQHQSVKHDSTINSFIKRVEDNQPDRNYLEDSKKLYQQQLLTDLYDFGTLKRHTSYAIKLLQEHHSSLQNNPVDEFTEMNRKLLSEVVVVANKFRDQLQVLFSENDEIEKNNQLQDRIKKASVYFSDKMHEVLESIITNTVIETDNKVVKKSIDHVLYNVQQ